MINQQLFCQEIDKNLQKSAKRIINPRKQRFMLILCLQRARARFWRLWSCDCFLKGIFMRYLWGFWNKGIFFLVWFKMALRKLILNIRLQFKCFRSKTTSVQPKNHWLTFVDLIKNENLVMAKKVHLWQNGWRAMSAATFEQKQRN